MKPADRPPPDLAALRERHPTHFAPLLAGRAGGLAAAIAPLLLLLFGMVWLGFFDGRLGRGMGKLGEMAVMMLPPDPGSWARARIYSLALVETVAIALLGTMAAAILAFPLSLLAAKNVVANRVLHFLTRRSLDTIRSIDTLVWALIWVNVVGLGPFAGVLALMTSDLGTFGKLFSEAIETADRKPVEGVVSTGASPLLRLRFGILPQVFPVIASQILYYFESNTRSATIIGIVGAGGIGMHLAEQIRTLELQQVSFIVLLILLAVMAIDWISAKIRFAIIGRSNTRKE